jgi:hypothetical protein
MHPHGGVSACIRAGMSAERVGQGRAGMPPARGEVSACIRAGMSAERGDVRWRAGCQRMPPARGDVSGAHAACIRSRAGWSPADRQAATTWLCCVDARGRLLLPKFAVGAPMHPARTPAHFARGCQRSAGMSGHARGCQGARGCQQRAGVPAHASARGGQRMHQRGEVTARTGMSRRARGGQRIARGCQSARGDVRARIRSRAGWSPQTAGRRPLGSAADAVDAFTVHPRGVSSTRARAGMSWLVHMRAGSDAAW